MRVTGKAVPVVVVLGLLVGQACRAAVNPQNAPSSVASGLSPLTLFASPSDEKKTAPSPPSVKLTWKASVPKSKSPRDAIAGYNIYRSESPNVKCTAANKIASVGGSVTSYTDSHVQAGKKYFYVATAVAASTKESDHPSNEASVTVP